MSDSEEENENFCYFGKPLDPYDEDSFPKKRPISVEEQIATDAQGRRRFHGAFMGGFSAGFFNTVGSLEGWAPSEYKSSRLDKAKGRAQKPEDFMDEEDLGEHGIAPQVVRATNDYSTSKKRKKQVFSDGPIPGEPVLHNLLTSGNETIGYMLLKNLGIKDKIKNQNEELTASDGKVYGCHMPKLYEISPDIRNNQYEIPKIYEDFLAKPKDNTFGLGYIGLDKNHFSLFPNQSSKFVVTDRNNKKMSISGQAFGVGAFESEDADIYMKDDINKYDFEIGGEKNQDKPEKHQQNLMYGMFIHSKSSLLQKKCYAPPQIPHSFTGIHKVRKSRFEPLPKEPETPGTSKINPMIRAKYLGEETVLHHTNSKTLIDPNAKSKDNLSCSKVSYDQSEEKDEQQSHLAKKAYDIASLYLSDKFVSSSKQENITDILEPVEKMETTHGTEQMREAARMKMFGPLTRITSEWHPCSLLCKRFNVPEPFVDRPEKSRTRTKNLIFEYQKHVEEEGNLKPGLSIQAEDKIKDEQQDSINEVVSIENAAKEDKEKEKKIDKLTENSIVVTTTNTENIETLPKDITDKVDLEKNMDLFRAVFLSSDSESESEENENKPAENNNTNIKAEELKSAVLSDQLIPKLKPMKEGILSNVNFHKFTNPNSSTENSNSFVKDSDNLEIQLASSIREKQKLIVPDPGLYGPKVPEKPIQNEMINIAISSSSEEEWVEKGSSSKKKKHKKEKKHKKDKHKKHKHNKKKKYKD